MTKRHYRYVITVQAAEFAGKGVLWHVESLKVASLSVRSAAPALLWTVSVPVRRIWFIPDCSYEHSALFSTLTTETAGWLAIRVFIYQVSWGFVLEGSNYREK